MCLAQHKEARWGVVQRAWFLTQSYWLGTVTPKSAEAARASRSEKAVRWGAARGVLALDRQPEDRRSSSAASHSDLRVSWSGVSANCCTSRAARPLPHT